jgi:signal transduction histidine kinase
MTLRHRIALTYSLVTTGILLVVMGYVYVHSLNYERNEFNHKLRDRAEIAVRTYLKTDELSREVMSEVRTEHLRSIKGEREFIMRVEDCDKGSQLPDFLDREFVNRVLETGEEYRHDENELATVGILEHDNQGDFLVFVAAENEVILKNLADLRNTLIALAIIYMIFVYSIGLWYASYALNPFRRMADHMSKADTGNLIDRLEEPTEQDEIWELAHAYNRLMDRIDTAQKVQQNFISNASHELKNPLTAILGEIDVTLQRERTNEEYREAMRVIDQESQRLNRLTMRLLHLAETSYASDGPMMALLDLKELLRSVVEDYSLSHPYRRLELTLLPDNDDPVRMTGNAQLIRIAVSNLIDNALKFSSDTVSVHLHAAQGRMEIAVTDHGIGIPEEDIGNLYIPFFRSENARVVPGFGIGLPLVKRIMDMHGGTLTIRSDKEKGTEFRLCFSARSSVF